MDEQTLYDLLKHGKSAEVAAFIRAEQKKEYSFEFPVFMDQMLAEYKIKRKTVAIRAGLSQEYTYKLLRGTKRTTERDYILAMCLAIGMNYGQTQHALSIYGMPTLNAKDIRSRIIGLAIKNGSDIDVANEWLEKAGFHYLKTSPEMPSSPVIFGGDAPAEPVRKQERNDVRNSRKVRAFTEISRKIEAIPCGHAPFDFVYRGALGLKDENGSVYYVTASYMPMGEEFSVLDEESYRLWDSDEAAPDDIPALESYESLEETGQSEFFRYFLTLDRDTDVKVRETMASADDSRDYRERFGYGKVDGAVCAYTEVFNHRFPEKREYLQVIEKENGETIFSASHESCYMRIELGDIYPHIFGKKKPEEYYVKASSLDELPEQYRYMRFIFREIQVKMHEWMRANGISVPDGAEAEDEKTEILAQRSAWYARQENWEESYRLLREMLPLVKAQDKAGRDRTVILAVTYAKLAALSKYMERPEEAKKWKEEICRLKDRIMSRADDGSARQAVFALAEAEADMAAECHEQGRFSEEKKLLEEALSRIDGRCEDITEWAALFRCLGNYAFAIDGEEPERSLEYYRSALDIARDQMLDRIPGCRMAIVTLYNNTAWVLWNRLGRDEAIVYYLRAVDMLEGYRARKQVDEEEYRENIDKFVEKLCEIYVKTGREADAERLKKRYGK